MKSLWPTYRSESPETLASGALSVPATCLQQEVATVLHWLLRAVRLPRRRPELPLIRHIQVVLRCSICGRYGADVVLTSGQPVHQDVRPYCQRQKRARAGWGPGRSARRVRGGPSAPGWRP